MSYICPYCKKDVKMNLFIHWMEFPCKEYLDHMSAHGINEANNTQLKNEASNPEFKNECGNTDFKNSITSKDLEDRGKK